MPSLIGGGVRRKDPPDWYDQGIQERLREVDNIRMSLTHNDGPFKPDVNVPLRFALLMVRADAQEIRRRCWHERRYPSC